MKQKRKHTDPPKAKTIPMKDICKLHGPVKKKVEIKKGETEEMAKAIEAEPTPGVCRVCGCTETTPCPSGCSWMDKTKTLCTACQMAKEHLWEKQNLVTVASTRKVPMHDIYKCKKCSAMGKRFGVGPIKPDKPFTELKCPGPKKDPGVKEKKIPCLDCANDGDNGGNCGRENFYADDDGDLICDSHKALQTSAKEKK